jgi:exopolysaccharide production protein ExoZ
MANQGKILSIQYLRGLAALGVVLCHYGSTLLLYPRLSTFFNFGQNGVYVFFLVSGFIIVYSLDASGYKPRQFLRFLLKRSIRIDPSYICIILVTILFFNCLSLSKGHGTDFKAGQFIAHVFYYIPFTNYPFYNHVFWTLSVEFQFYLIVGLLYFLSAGKVFQQIFLIVFSSTCFFKFSNSEFLVISYAPIFALGISLIQFYLDRSLKNLILPALIFILIVFKFGWLIFLLLFGSSLLIVYFKIVVKPLALLGDISYSLYLTHGLTLIFFIGIGKRLSLDFDHYQLMWLLFEVILAIVVAYIFFILIEKPSMNFSKRISYIKKHTLRVS